MNKFPNEALNRYKNMPKVVYLSSFWKPIHAFTSAYQNLFYACTGIFQERQKLESVSIVAVFKSVVNISGTT
jgi:hypothetical protein